MKWFFAMLNDEKTLKVSATRMELVDSMLLVYDGDSLVACADIGVVLYAQINERE